MEFGSVRDILSYQVHPLNCNHTAVEFHTASMLGKLHFLNPVRGGGSPFAPTHRDGHILDIVVTRINDMSIVDLDVKDLSLSDHFLLSFCVPYEL